MQSFLLIRRTFVIHGFNYRKFRFPENTRIPRTILGSTSFQRWRFLVYPCQKGIRKDRVSRDRHVSFSSREPVHPGDKKARNEERKKNLSRGIRLCILFLSPQRRLSKGGRKGLARFSSR